MQTPQTNQTIKQFTPKTIFLIFVKSGLLQYNTTNKGSRPEILEYPGEMREEKRKTTIFNTTNKGLCSMSNEELRRDTFRRETTSLENKTVTGKRKSDSEIRSKDSVPTQNCEDTRQKGLKSIDDQDIYPESEEL